MVVFRDPAESVRALKAIDEVAKKHGVKPEFKFSKSRPEVRDAFFEAVQSFDFCVRAIVVRKEVIQSGHLRSNKEAFYSFFVKSMLKFDNGLLKGASVVIDGSGERIFKQELAAYLRRHTEKGAIKKVRFSDSRNDRLVQMADMCTGAIARSFRDNRGDARRWHQMLGKKIEDIWDFK